MKKWMLIVFALLLLAACKPGETQEVVCHSPEIRSGDGCCLDLDEDGICDNTPTSEAANTTVKSFPETGDDEIDNSSVERERSVNALQFLEAFNDSGSTSSEDDLLTLYDIRVEEKGFDTQELSGILVETHSTGSLRVELKSAVGSEEAVVEVDGDRSWKNLSFEISELEYPRTLSLVLSSGSGKTSRIEKEINFSDYRDKYEMHTLQGCEYLEDSSQVYKCKGIVSAKRGDKNACEELRESPSNKVIVNHAWCVYGYVSVTGDMRYCNTIEYWRADDLQNMRGKCEDIARLR